MEQETYMKQFYLTEIVTKDKLIHQGVFFKPKNFGKRAILYVHGLTSTFYGSVRMLEALAQACEKRGMGFAAFNNRGHDMIVSIRKVDKNNPKGYTHTNGGAGYEIFEDSIFDIDAGIQFLRDQGYGEIVLIGHSTGANKVCFWAATQKNEIVVGVVLASPLSDRLDTEIDKKKLKKDISFMKNLVKKGKGNELVLGYHYFPMTPKRFLSIFEPNSMEDMFDYGDEKPKLAYFSRIKKPLLVILGSRDEYLDRPVENVFEVFKRFTHSRRFQCVIIPSALHSFNGKEKEVVQTIIDWVRLL